MAENTTFNYGKNYFFLFFGGIEILLAFLLIMPLVFCPFCWRQTFFSEWRYWYVFMLIAGFVFLRGGLVNLLFWFCHVRKKPYLTITPDMILIDAETDIKIDDIVSIAPCKMLGCTMLCLELKNPRDYKLSWRFRADRIFHKKYAAFVCPGLVDPNQRQAFTEWFECRFPKSDDRGG